ncbi:MAG: TetR/AcrR family transcriptional regulator [Propionicimonas sp.]|uniref:TetR/AcrR family transcriptional regulator n=1 Tax=Propionicimonas sp. TaxID=1955623 RepID=UPI003D10DC8B
MPLTDDVPVKRKVNRQAEASAQRRQQIMDAAVAAFTEAGFNGTSIREVAIRAGMSHTGVLHHFPDKTALLEAVLDRYLEGGLQEVRIDPDDGLSLLRGLVALAEHDLTDPDSLRMYRMLSSEALSPTHPAHGYFTRWYAQVRDWATTGLEDLRRRGLYAQPDLPIPDAAAQIAGMRDGLDPQWLLDPAAIDLVKAVRSQAQLYATERID